jgi:DNA-binding CsgD family transcriptional regulator
MNTAESIAKQSMRILRQIDNALQLEDRGVDDDIVKALYYMHKLYPSCAIITCPVRNPNFFYISDNCHLVFGYTPQYMATHFKTIESYFAELHEADMGDFRDCINFIETFMRSDLQEDYRSLRMILHYRFRHADGRYLYLQDERATLVAADGNVVFYSLIRTMPEESVFSGTKVEIYEDGNVFQKIVEYKPSAAKNKLSKRENDLVVLIKKGLTTKEIAWHLNISHNTVRNIKSKLFEKYSVNNTIELLNMTG